MSAQDARASSAVYFHQTGIYSATEPDSFVRIEDKFLVSKQHEAELSALLHRHLRPRYPDPSTEFCAIESVYFDSGSLDLFKDHFLSNDERFKLRTRRYGASGSWSDPTLYLELKRKSRKNGVTKKSRFRISQADYEGMREGRSIPLSIELRHCNADLDGKKLLKRLQRVNDLIESYRLRPSCVVKYIRRAFEQDGLRVTCDDAIGGEMIGGIDPAARAEILRSEWIAQRAGMMRDSFEKTPHLLLEVKHAGTVPEWMMEFLRDTGSQAAGFSKYCYNIWKQLNGP